MAPMIGLRATAALLATSGALAAASAASCGTVSVAGAGGGAAGGAPAGTGAGISFVSGVGGSMQSCPDAGPPDAGGEGGGDASNGCEGLEGGVSYASDVVHIFEGCTGEACHSAPSSSHVTTVGVPAYECCNQRLVIDPGNAAQSYLLDKLEGHDLCQGVRMPFGLPPLPADEILTIRRWICEGAPDN